MPFGGDRWSQTRLQWVGALQPQRLRASRSPSSNGAPLQLDRGVAAPETEQFEDMLLNVVTASIWIGALQPQRLDHGESDSRFVVQLQLDRGIAAPETPRPQNNQHRQRMSFNWIGALQPQRRARVSSGMDASAVSLQLDRGFAAPETTALQPLVHPGLARRFSSGPCPDRDVCHSRTPSRPRGFQRCRTARNGRGEHGGSTVANSVTAGPSRRTIAASAPACEDGRLRLRQFLPRRKAKPTSRMVPSLPVHVDRRSVLEPEGHPPVVGDRHGAAPFQSSRKSVQAEAWQVHAFGTRRSDPGCFGFPGRVGAFYAASRQRTEGLGWGLGEKGIAGTLRWPGLDLRGIQGIGWGIDPTGTPLRGNLICRHPARHCIDHRPWQFAQFTRLLPDHIEATTTRRSPTPASSLKRLVPNESVFP